MTIWAILIVLQLVSIVVMVVYGIKMNRGIKLMKDTIK
jgi:hypothetical protein